MNEFKTSPGYKTRRQTKEDPVFPKRPWRQPGSLAVSPVLPCMPWEGVRHACLHIGWCLHTRAHACGLTPMQTLTCTHHTPIPRRAHIRATTMPLQDLVPGPGIFHFFLSLLRSGTISFQMHMLAPSPVVLTLGGETFREVRRGSLAQAQSAGRDPEPWPCPQSRGRTGGKKQPTASS